MLPDPAVDEATVLRGWESAKYTYPSGAVATHPTYAANYEDRPDWLQNDYAYIFIEPAILFADVAALPLWVVIEPATTLVSNHGVYYPSSMTVAPPLPRE